MFISAIDERIMAEELSKVYEPEATEKEANELWFSNRHFHAEPAGEGNSRRPYTIVIPPPNVTAPLHLGHALNNALQDILIRFRRMQNRNTLWMPGTDHAGIATQTVVEKGLLSEQGKRRTDFERKEFVAHVQAWKDEYEARIISQLKAMGCSCDWDRTRFTMDPVCAKAVRAAFFKLFRDGLIYRGKRLVNWDPATQTVLADDEVEHETVKGHFWYMRYPLVEPVEIEGETIEHVTVATTRPETMLGDTAVAMNPNDPRAKYLIGSKVQLPIVGRIIPIIPDEHVVLPDPESEDEKAKFSTGFLKVTPAHDPDDWEIGQRHNLDIVNVMAPDGTISDRYGWEDATDQDAQSLLGMDRFEAREAVVEWFRQENLLEDVREYTHEVGHSYRSHVPIEPYLSDQWYIAVKKPIEHLKEKFGQGLIDGTDVPVNSLAGLALKPLLDGRLRFIPERYARTYHSWLENLRDWPISRQLWWGHRIPIWSKSDTKEFPQLGDQVHNREKAGSEWLVAG
jgi:valyl-tRNA synthetase